MNVNQLSPHEDYPTQPQPGDEILGPGLFLHEGRQYGEGIPQHLRGTQPIGLARRVLFHLVNGIVLQLFIYVLGYLLQALGVQVFEPGSVQLTWTGVVYQTIINVAILIYFAVTGWMLPLAPWFAIRQVQVGQPQAPGWRGIGKYILHGLLSILAMIPYLVVVFGTRDQVQRHAVDRLTGVIVLDVATGRDPLEK